jgi:hypothetical protein
MHIHLLDESNPWLPLDHFGYARLLPGEPGYLPPVAEPTNVEQEEVVPTTDSESRGSGDYARGAIEPWQPRDKDDGRPLDSRSGKSRAAIRSSLIKGGSSYTVKNMDELMAICAAAKNTSLGCFEWPENGSLTAAATMTSFLTEMLLRKLTYYRPWLVKNSIP